MARKYKSRIARSVHETAKGLCRIGAVSKKTMREFDMICLVRRPAKKTRARRKR
jgi:putative transcriptional regulator